MHYINAVSRVVRTFIDAPVCGLKAELDSSGTLC